MWIKSQDCKELIKTERIQREGNSIYVILMSINDYLKVGEFKTEEDAKSEFENIEFAIITNQKFYEIREDE